MENNQNAISCKVVLIGEAGVGSTSIINRYINNTFSTNSMSTTGASFTAKTMYFEKNINWPLWDGIPRENALLLGITFFFLIFFFLYPSPLFSLTHQMALALSL